MRRRRNVGLVLAALALLLPAICAAQETTGTLSGTVVNPQGEPLPFATVTVTGPRGERQVATDEEGRFLVAFLVPGTYTVSVAAEGFSPLTDDAVRIGLGQRSVRNYTVVPAVEEQVEVVGERVAPSIDVSSQSTGANIPTEIAEQIPLGRNVQNIVFLAPGAKDGGGTGPANASIGGSSGLENQYVFDGANVTNAGYGALGSYSIIYQSLGQGINFNFVEETQVITGGYAPEFGQSTGGIINVLTKSGTNEWKGQLFGYYTPTGLQGSFKTPDLLNSPQAPTLGVERLDYGFDVGGPLVKDKVFFWLGANPTATRTERRGLDPALVGPFTRELKSLNYGGKVTFQLNPDHRIDLSLFGDPTETNLTFNRGSSALRQPTKSRWSELEFGGQNWVANYAGTVNPRFLINATIARAKNKFEEIPGPLADQWLMLDLVPAQLGVGGTGLSGGLGFFEAENESTNEQARVKFTNLIGDHELSYGVGIERVDYVSDYNRTGPTITTREGDQTTTGAEVERRISTSVAGLPGVRECVDDNGAPIDCAVMGDLPVIYRIVRADLEGNLKETTTDYNFAFIQDDWAITPNLHLDFGLRWEKQDLVGAATKYSLPAEIAPRAGISWDHTGRGDSKLYAHFGDFYEKVPLDIAVRLFSPEVTITAGDYYDALLTQPIPDRFAVSGSGTTRVAKGTRTSKLQEFVLGYERMVPRGWQLKAEYQHRELKRILEDTHVGVFYTDADGDGTPDPSCLNYLATNPGADQLGYGGADIILSLLHGEYGGCVSFGEFVVGNPPEDLGVTLRPGLSFAKPEREYHALVLQATKSAPNWYFQLQYVLSRLHGNYEGLYRNDNGQSDPNLTSLWDFPNDPTFFHTFSPGALNTDRTHRLQAFGFYNWQSGWSLGSRFVVQSGTPRVRLASLFLYGSSGEVALDRRGTLGRTPTEWNLDVNVAKTWDLPTPFESQIGVEVDVFNLLGHRYANDFIYDFDIGSSGDVETAVTEQELVDAIAAASGVRNVDFNKALAYNAPREIRFGVKWTF